MPRTPKERGVTKISKKKDLGKKGIRRERKKRTTRVKMLANGTMNRPIFVKKKRERLPRSTQAEECYIL